MEAYELVEEFEEAWANLPKGFPLEKEAGNSAVFGAFVPVGGLRMYVSLTVGPRGGIRETVVVIDPQLRVVADRLVVYSTDGGGVSERGLLLPLSDLRARVAQTAAGKQRKALAIQLCRDTLWDFVERLDDDVLRPESLRLLPSTSESLIGISAGAPSLGRRGGGTGRSNN